MHRGNPPGQAPWWPAYAAFCAALVNWANTLIKRRILLNEHIEDDGWLVFDHACKLGLEGIVAKNLDAPYRSR